MLLLTSIQNIGNAAFFAAYTQTKLFVIELEKKIEIGKVKKLEKNEKRNLLFNSENKIEKQSKSKVMILSKYENEKNGKNGVMSEIKEETREICDSVGTVNPGTAFRAVLLAGAMAGAAYVISSHPLEIASILMQTDIPIKIPLNNPIISPIINSINGPINAAIKPLFTPIMSSTTTQTLPALLTTVAPSISLLQGLSNSFQNTVSTIAHTARTKGFVSFVQTDRSLSYRWEIFQALTTNMTCLFELLFMTSTKLAFSMHTIYRYITCTPSDMNICTRTSTQQYCLTH